MIVPVGGSRRMVEFKLSAYSKYQQERLIEILKSEDFDFAVSDWDGLDNSNNPRKSGKQGFLWYTTDGNINYELMGCFKTLRASKTKI